MRFLRLAFLALALTAPACIASGAALAHPHIWIRAHATLQFENGKIVGILNEWTFDDFFSNAIISDFDKNKNKIFDPDEIKDVAANAFAALKEYGYFTHVRVNGKPVAIAETRDFVPSIKDGRVIYHFVAVLPQPVDPRSEKFDASVYDESYYVDVDLNPKAGVKLAGTGAEACKFAVVEDRASPLYFGTIFARRIEISCAR